MVKNKLQSLIVSVSHCGYIFLIAPYEAPKRQEVGD